MSVSAVRLLADGSSWEGGGGVSRLHAVRGSRPLFSWSLDSTERGAEQRGFELSIYETDGSSSSSVLVWASGRHNSSMARLRYPADAPALMPATTYAVEVSVFDGRGEARKPAAARFHVPLRDWDGVNWLGSAKHNIYRSTFATSTGLLRSAVLYICALGFSRLWLNGAELDSMTLTVSPWTRYSKRVGFSSIEVGHLLQPAGQNNTLGVELGHGWRARQFLLHNLDGDARMAGTVPRVLRAKLVATYGVGNVDGTPLPHQRVSPSAVATSMLVLSHTGDGSWQAATGPTLEDDVYDGEVYDARIAHAMHGWSAASPSSVGAVWEHALAILPASRSQTPISPVAEEDGGLAPTAPSGRMVPWAAPPVTVGRVLTPASLRQTEARVWLADFGSNLAGVVRLSGITCKAGTTLTILHSEILQHSQLPGVQKPDSMRIYTANLRSAKQRDMYICAGLVGETWAARMTYHGFRYAEIRSSDPSFNLTASNVQMLHIHSSLPRRAHVDFSAATLNRLQAMAVGAQRSNFMTVPTDCPQRDERLGWLGDVSLSADSITLNFDARNFLLGFLDSIVDEIGVDGSLPAVVPSVRFGERPADVSWSAALVGIMHALWRIDGEIDMYKQHMPALVAHLSNVAKLAAHGLGKMHTPHGDWCPPPTRTGTGQGTKPSPSLASAFSYIRMVQQAAKLTEAAGDAVRTHEMRVLEKSLLSQYNDAFWKGSTSANKTYDSGVQSALVLSLAVGAPPSEDVAMRTHHALTQSVADERYHYTTGILGFKHLFDELDKFPVDTCVKEVGRKTAAAVLSEGSTNTEGNWRNGQVRQPWDGAMLQTAHGLHLAARPKLPRLSLGSDLSLAILMQLDYPSIGYGFANPYEPANESLWELADAPFEGPGMNSRNHHMWSSYSEYLVRSVVGISPITTLETDHQKRRTLSSTVEEEMDSPVDPAERLGRTQGLSDSPLSTLLLRPAQHKALHSARAHLSLPHGDALFSWSRSGGIQADLVAHGDTAVLDCSSKVAIEHGQGWQSDVFTRQADRVFDNAHGQDALHQSSTQGGVIKSILFASFGTPRHGASIGEYKVDAACHASTTPTVVEEACVGRAMCKIRAIPSTFDLPEQADQTSTWCTTASLRPLRLLVAVQCSESDALHVEALVPPSSTALLHLPALARFGTANSSGLEGLYDRRHRRALTRTNGTGRIAMSQLSLSFHVPIVEMGRRHDFVLVEMGRPVFDTRTDGRDGQPALVSRIPGIEFRHESPQGDLELEVASGFYHLELLPI